MNVITVEDYKRLYWPKLESAIEQLLTQTAGDYIPISYEQIYSCVYKCVCQQHSEQMYSDLLCKITQHLHQVSQELQVPCHTYSLLCPHDTLHIQHPLSIHAMTLSSLPYPTLRLSSPN
ncbi:hypothetical protein AB205_0054160 [Aquarana catesbeiana]|uniref:Cullin N-terminal domain-containing protein n=1 Tax=Aquarana catesbeiana TaxID=8400 RepID=A0A2G9QAM3_AQUCT|nr:hypothetical protein AB205_0067310 [Aquarana catesbeiana]PIO13161.1 hypothetical protein AB205_0054160 [Aquarana catesbeiana]